MKIIIMLLLVPSIFFGQNNIKSPKRELRAAWIATVFNIDWPSKKGLLIGDQKNEMIAILDKLRELKFNAAILQIKPTSDAFYRSKLSPWSQYLSGIQGVDPGYDPLAFFIEEAKKRAIETHVWVNPYRILNGDSFDVLCGYHIARKNPDWVIEYNGRYYFDPGHPFVRNRIIREVVEIVDNYDIDVIHMDDYFYPYKVYKDGKALEFDDKATWQRYGKGFDTIEDWRRHNVNTFVRDVSKAIKKSKPYVGFGISPFGVWRNQSKDIRGSLTEAGQTNYDDLYADVLTWINEQWIDYIMPQIYWHFDTRVAPYDVLVRWWNTVVKDKVNLYIGIGLYKLGEQNWPATHIIKQVDYARQYPNVGGESFYSVKWIMNDTKGIQQDFTNTIYPYYSLIPKRKTHKDTKPQTINDLQLIEKNDATYLTWKKSRSKDIRYYVVYRFHRNQKPDMTQSSNILTILPSSETEFKLKIHKLYDTYGVTAVTRLNEESELFTIIDQEKFNGLELVDQLIANPSTNN